MQRLPASARCRRCDPQDYRFSAFCSLLSAAALLASTTTSSPAQDASVKAGLVRTGKLLVRLMEASSADLIFVSRLMEGKPGRHRRPKCRFRTRPWTANRRLAISGFGGRGY